MWLKISIYLYANLSLSIYTLYKNPRPTYLYIWCCPKLMVAIWSTLRQQTFDKVWFARLEFHLESWHHNHASKIFKHYQIHAVFGTCSGLKLLSVATQYCKASHATPPWSAEFLLSLTWLCAWVIKKNNKLHSIIIDIPLIQVIEICRGNNGTACFSCFEPSIFWSRTGLHRLIWLSYAMLARASMALQTAIV